MPVKTSEENWFESELVRDPSLISSLAKMREGVEILWNRRLIQDFTLHDLAHSQRIVRFVKQILEPGDFVGEKLYPEEAYILLAAIYLHDIGMQCTEPAVLSEFNITISPSSFTSQLQQNENFLKAIRENHHEIAAKWIRYLFKQSGPESQLANGIASIPPEWVDTVIDVARYHTKLDIADCEQSCFIPMTRRKRLLAMLLRLADELDIARERVDIDDVLHNRLPIENSVYWWRHYCTRIVIEKGEIRFQITVCEDEPEELRHNLKSLVVDGFFNKNESLLYRLSEEGVRLRFYRNIDVNRRLFQTTPHKGLSCLHVPATAKDMITKQVHDTRHIEDGSHKRVLIVEDNQGWGKWIYQHIPVRILNCKIECYPVIDNFESWLLFLGRSNFAFDLLIADLHLNDFGLWGELSGFDVIERLPIGSSAILITASANTDDFIGLITDSSRVKAFLSKRDLSPHMLGEAVAKALNCDNI